jgi:uncharacterized protein (DUF2147 family)
VIVAARPIGPIHARLSAMGFLHQSAALVGNTGRGAPVATTSVFVSPCREWKMKLRLAAIACAILMVGSAHSQPKPDKPVASKPNQHKSAASAPNQNKTAAGFWAQVGDDGFVGGWFYFIEQNGLYEGRLVKMFLKPDETQIINTCDKCAGDQKDAPMLGLTIVKDMKRNGAKYEEGSILDPRDGTVYHAQMELSPDGLKLSVRGYLGIPLLGQTQVWTRLPDDAIAPADIPKESLGPTAAAPQ